VVLFFLDSEYLFFLIWILISVSLSESDILKNKNKIGGFLELFFRIFFLGFFFRNLFLGIFFKYSFHFSKEKLFHAKNDKTTKQNKKGKKETKKKILIFYF
jgi:hypothetical protein